MENRESNNHHTPFILLSRLSRVTLNGKTEENTPLNFAHLIVTLRLGLEGTHARKNQKSFAFSLT